ncbi:RagB/SusD family nutrient uptake outer membrane protein [Nibribacter ruber]|uniref:RagB/SusD family nutrient uptake outer membrane protein n=1 Tax=Nibribacter ruber TaxID=2698458 RepID=A0A6P1NZK7_9BACT|nr:RagB/SusD family nutrient uptake outer membrane protein [Nibribacter ruber]QHL87605.1 RagB/SusD family nutrient uptake outer membrane protein [Nibribacter ruber]
MKNILKKLFKAKVIVCALGLVTLSGCDDYLEREPMSDYLSSNFYNNEGAIKQGANGVYQRLKMNHGSTSNIPFSILWDMYTPFGIERADNSSVGVGNIDLRTNFSNELLWSTLYTSVARANSVLDGAAPFYGELNDNAKRYLAEIKVLRAHFYIQLVSIYGDVPYFPKSVTSEQLTNVNRTPWNEVVDAIITDLDDASTNLPWTATEWGRVDKSVAQGLKARIALYAGSWHKFGYGMDAEKNPAQAEKYFRISAAAAKKIMDEGGKGLANNYNDLFTRVGQMKPDAKRENMFFMMFSDFGDKSSQYMSLGEQVRMIGQSGRFPTQQLVDTYETSNGKRIDEAGSGYDPKKPFENRDPRLKYTIYTHHDTIIGNTGSNKMKFLMEVYKPQTKSWDENGNLKMIDNKDYTGSVAQYGYVQSGVGFAWRKYNHFDDESSALPTYNIILMRYAEILLTYAEAKIELGEIDATVVNAIDQVRARVGMPGILTSDPGRTGNQLKMRQIVRRERKVELAKESLHFFDMRRWRIGGLQNAEPTYGYPLATGVNASQGIYPDGYDQATPDMVPSFGAGGSERDINDIASYQAYASKLRTRDRDRKWNDMFYLWPIPQTERNKAPWLTQNKGYGL